MQIDPFEEDLKHRKIKPYSKEYPILFEQVREYVESSLPAVQLLHIGSTAIPKIAGKPMIDTIAVTEENLREIQQQLMELGFHRRDVWTDTDTKPYVCGSVLHQSAVYNVNIHICHPGDSTHTELIAFRDYLRKNEDARLQYEQAKLHAHEVDPVNPQVYNQAKEPVIQSIMAAIKEESK